MRAFRSALFWIPFLVTAALCGAFFAWELGYLTPPIPSFLRPPLSQGEVIITWVLTFLLALNAGLFVWQRHAGSCPLGVRRASGIGAALGAFALICPACTVIPLTLLGTSLTLGFFAPFLPLLRLVAVLILVVVTGMLWPRS